MDAKQNTPNQPVIPEAIPGRLSNGLGFGLALQDYRDGWLRRRTRLACLPFQSLRGLGAAVAGQGGGAPALFPWLLGQGRSENPADGSAPDRTLRPLSPSRPASRPPSDSRWMEPSPVPEPQSPIAGLSGGRQPLSVPESPLQEREPRSAAPPSIEENRLERNPAVAADSGPMPVGVRHAPSRSAGMQEAKTSMAVPPATGLPWFSGNPGGPDKPGDKRPPLALAEDGPLSVPVRAQGVRSSLAAPVDQPPILQRLAAMAGVRTGPPEHVRPAPDFSGRGAGLDGGPWPQRVGGQPGVDPKLALRLAMPMARPRAAPEAHGQSLPSAFCVPTAKTPPEVRVAAETVEKIVTRQLEHREARARAASATKAHGTQPAAAVPRPQSADEEDAARRLAAKLRRMQQSERFRSGRLR